MRKLLLFILIFNLFFAFGIPNNWVNSYKANHKTSSSSNKKISLDTSHPQSKSERLTAKSALSLNYQGLSLDILEGSVESAVRISVHHLGAKEIKNLPLSLVNVTRDAEGYRFKPKGLQLKKEADIALAYDETKIPEGYTAKDIFIFYYDQKSKSWQKLDGSKVEENKEKVKSHKLEVKGKITQFSDFIAGIIKLPESPDTSGFTPTSISGLKAADPLSGVQSIAPPTANPEGSATTSFAIELPKGRAGMQPSISLQYSNDGGHSWVGQGWNLSLPSVNIDTRWGAPRYDAQRETESYTLGGEELLPNTHRAEWENRTEDKIFYPRREGAFSKIIRKGNHPNNYHWEVASKSGIVSYYGNNTNSNVQTANGNIAHWQISEQRDLRGNTINYEYENVEGVLYPKAIYYTGHGGEKGKYSVHFITDADLGEAPRADVQVSARLGLKQVYNRLLRKVEVKYDNQMVRSYELVYEEGEYKKTLLKEIRQYDAEGNLFYANAMEYYNDVRDENGNYTPFGALEKWQVPRDEIKYTILGLNGLAGNPTLAGTSNAETSGVNYRVGVGLVGLGKYFVNTLGGHGSNSSGKSHSKVLLQDIDGDNLPDKIYLDDSGVYYRKNLSTSGLLGFGERQKINLSHLGRTQSHTNSYGAGLSIEFGEHTKVGGNIGYDKQNTKSTTASYFMDFNGDGLVDFVNGGMVYYNRLVNGIPHFEISSTGTPAPVLGSGASLLSNIEPEYTREELKEKNPLHDIVRTWTAPYTGTIKVKHQYQLIEDHSQERKEYQNNDGTPRADGVMLYFQHKGNLVWKERILAEDYTLKNKTDNINIRKGDVLYFRVSSVYDGNYDTTYWLPEIEYQEIDTQEKDENGLSLKKYHPEQDAIYPSEHYVVFPAQVSPRLKGIFEKKATTDKVYIRIYKTHTETHQESLIAEKIYDEIAVNDDLSNLNLGGFSEDELLSIRMYSPTEIDWRSVELSPEVEYSYQGQRFSEKVGIDYEIYAKVDEHYIPTTVESWEQGQVFLTLNNAQTSPNPLKDAQNNPLNGSILLTGKTANESVSRTHYEVINGILQEKIPASEQITKEIESNTPIYFVLTASSLDLYEALKRENYRIKAKIGNVFASQTYNNYLAYIPFKSPDVEPKFGKSFRGWGSFIINGDKTGEIINESLLVDKYGDYDETHLPNVDTFDPDVERPELEASGVYFVRTRGVLDNNTQKHRYVGTDPEVFLSGRIMSPARLGENDLQEYLDVSLPILQGGASPALAMISQGKSKAISYGINASVEVSDKKDDDSSIGGGVGGSKSWGEHKVTQTMSDFNGDRFPDFIRGGLVQYTTPRGGVSAQFQHIGDFNISKTESTGGSINGTYNHASPKTSIDTNLIQNDTQKTDGNKTGTQDADKARSTLSMSAGIGVSSSSDHSEMAYIDINGDGLADRVTAYSVAYNTGYGFLPEEPISIGSLNSGESNDVSGGPSLSFAVGKSKWSGSFSGGYNLAKSTSHIKTQFLDLTGDGLLDKITHDKEGIKVELNLGNRWGNAFILPHLSSRQTGKNVSISHGGSINAAVNFPTFWGIRITVGGGGSYGTNTSRVEATFMDIDGDGHLDYVLSEDEDDLRVAKSNFRRTNMLRGVTNGAGNYWEIDYEWKAPTYDNPNSAWVLKSVKLFDGHIGDGEDFSITHFEYEKPYYDRRERTFYGYEVVKQHAINPQDNSILRTSVQEFYNQDYFRKSLLKSAYTLGKNGQKLSESFVKYHIANAKTGVTILPSDLFLPALDATSVFIAPSEEIERSYEGTAYLEHKNQKKYDQNGNIVKFIDLGNGNVESQISAQIEYYESQAPYYGGIAKKLEVRDNKGLVRKREAEINPATAELIKVKNYFTASEFAQTDLEYDKFGNLKSITGAENEKGQRATLVYTYDNATHSHITSIKDQFGYENLMAYDLRFNTPIKTTDRNGETMSYTLDAKGRIATILAPKEAKAGKPYTIKYEYPSPLTPKGGSNPSNGTGNIGSNSPFGGQGALTLNYDPEHDRNIETYTYADGLGRIVQVKKTAAIFKGKGIADEEQHIVSGKQIYDALGRVVETYYPTTAPISSVGYQEPSTINHQSSTKTLYDDKDRVIEQIFPDGSKTMVNYQLSMLNGLSTINYQLSTKTTDALGRTSIVYTDAKGQKTKVVQPTGIETHFEYSAIGELTKVIDADGHQTLSEYDLLGRRTKLTHPDAGTTLLQYDKASNLIRRQTSQIREEMPTANIVYNYDFNRLQEIKYPKHPDNNVRYHYGSQKEEAGRRGRLWLVEDASGGVEYFYGDMGEVEKEIRTIRISPSEVQTYITEYEYDSWNRIQKMVYPDGERLDFGYNIAGNLTSLTGYKSPLTPKGGNPPSNGMGSISNTSPFGGQEAGLYTYIQQQGYDEFEQKVYRRLGNDTETTYTYDPVMRRLSELSAIKPPHPQGGNNSGIPPLGGRGLLFQNNKYSYDLVGNILSVENAINHQLSTINQLGGSSKYTYEYDELNRLIKAKGTFEGTSNKADYELNMQYNRLNGIVQKALKYTLNGEDKGYTLNYEYNDKKHPHAPSSISGIAPFGGQGAGKPRNYTYDGNGNPTYYDEFKGFRSMVWDEENRLRGINDNGRLHLYTYDHTGERALKSSAESSMAVINGLASAVITHTEDYTAYISPYFVVQKGKFTKHYFEGSSRIVSKLGEGTFSQNKPKITAGGVDYFTRTQKEQEARDRYIKGLNTPPGPPTQHGIYASPEWTKQPYPSIDWEAISQNQEPPQGWPRYPRFNEPGDVPGPPVQFGEPLTNANARAGFNFIPNGVEEKNLYYYHPDHLGSSSYITDKNGEVIQHTEYMAFGEVFVDEHSTTNKMPYLFNSKELDYETGLYYYGARYYDPKTSIFLNVDPLVEKTGTPYAYTYNNPIRYIDPDGKAPIDDHFDQYGNFLRRDNKSTNNIIIHHVKTIDNSNFIQKMVNSIFETSFGIEIKNIQTELKDFKFDKSNFSTLVKIAKHYSKEAGVDTKLLYNEDFSVGAFNNVKFTGGQPTGILESYNGGEFWGMTIDGSMAIMHAEPDINKITINVFDGKVSPLLNDKYNFISVLGHEGGKKGHLGLPNAKHTTIYENQKKAHLYKHTTKEFKEHIEENIKYYKQKGD